MAGHHKKHHHRRKKHHKTSKSVLSAVMKEAAKLRKQGSCASTALKKAWSHHGH